MKNTENKSFQVEVVLLEPEIPQNTGNIARTCAALRCPLHIVEPLGFSLRDRHLRRAGIDYWDLVDLRRYKNFNEFKESNKNGILYFFTSRGQKSYHYAEYNGLVYLVFGKESTGLSIEMVEENKENCYRIPMYPGIRSLNLATTVGIVIYEAFRQNNFFGLSGFDESINL